MTGNKPAGATLISRKGEAKPPPEPAIRPRRTVDGRRVGATLPIEIYVGFKAYIARNGITGEQAIVAAIGRLLRDA
jgi:hypothetical protein